MIHTGYFYTVAMIDRIDIPDTICIRDILVFLILPVSFDEVDNQT